MLIIFGGAHPYVGADIFAILKLSKNIVTAFLILVMILQLLPVRQAVKYFLIDNQTVEEVLHVEKGATKNLQLLEEDHKYMPATDDAAHHFSILNNSYPFHTAVVIPPFDTAEIPTPPPDFA
jgi:hypothetical protein